MSLQPDRMGASSLTMWAQASAVLPSQAVQRVIAQETRRQSAVHHRILLDALGEPSGRGFECRHASDQGAPRTEPIENLDIFH